jgi:tRNA(fMet)-specific endonuclease VapC
MPAGGNLLLDTNAFIAFLEGDANVRALIASETTLLLSVTVLGELWYGAYKSARQVANAARINTLISTGTILPCEGTTAVEYGRIKSELERKGKLIPDNDMWIAATARQHGLTLVSRDGHFVHVDGLKVEAW